MTPLRRQMIEDMSARGLARKTKEAYLRAVFRLARYYNKSPDALTMRGSLRLGRNELFDAITAVHGVVVKKPQLRNGTCRHQPAQSTTQESACLRSRGECIGFHDPYAITREV